MSTNISWTDETWNPVVGCERVSPGCAHCYAKAIHDMRHQAFHEQKSVPQQYAQPFEHVQLMYDRLERPLHWRKSRRIFVNSVSDLFHKDVPDEFIDEVFNVMWRAHWHIFQILTKRPERMKEYMEGRWYLVNKVLPNVWLGTSVENQRWANERIPLLLHTPAAVRFLSCEPLLGPLDIAPFLHKSLRVHICLKCHYFSNVSGETHCPNDGWELVPDVAIDWVIVGGESGPNYRTMHFDWARSLRDQCVAAGVPFFFKQGNGYRSEQCALLDGQEWHQFPEVAA